MNLALGPIQDKVYIGLQTTEQELGRRGGANKKFVLNLETMDTAGLVSNVGTSMSVYINIITSLMTARTVLDQLSLMLGLT